MTEYNTNNFQPNSVELALFWASHGFKVFPVGKNKKPNLGFRWKDYATTDSEMIKAYWNGAHKGAAVGIVTGKYCNVLVIDVDNKNGNNGNQSLKELEDKYGSLPDTLTVQTPSGGYHYFVTYNDCGLTIDSNILDGIDYRGENGYVVAAGSITQDGQYQIVNNSSIADMLEWMPDVLSRRDINTGNNAVITSQKYLKSGNRNNSLISYAGTLRRKGAEQDEILEALTIMNLAFDEPLPDTEVESVAKSIMRYAPSDVSVYANEQDFSERLAKDWIGHVRYVPALGFILNENDVWVRDVEALRVKRLLQDACNKAYAELEEISKNQKSDQKKATRKVMNKIKSRAFQSNCLEMLKSHPEILTLVDDLDQYTDHIGTNKGVLNLNTRQIVDDGGSYLITKRFNVAYDADSKCPHFDAFMERIFPDKQTRAYVLKSLGYALSGESNLRAFFIWVGSGANGKSTLLESVSHVMADYSVTLDPQSFIKKMAGAISNDIALLRGARLCVTSETSAGAVLDTALIKRLCGNDTITARFLHQEYFEFQNQAVIFMASNYVPVFDGSCGAFTGRVNIVPFDEVIPESERDPALLDKLKAESAGIFNRLLDAYDAYKREGLTPPPAVFEATEKFCSQSNLIRQFVDECLDMADDQNMPVSVVYHRYCVWATSMGYKPLSGNVFSAAFEAETGISKKRVAGGMYWVGLTHKQPQSQNPMGF